MVVGDAIKMINYALRQWRSERSREFFDQKPCFSATHLCVSA